MVPWMHSTPLERIHFCGGQKNVIPAKAGIQPNGVHTVFLVPGFRRDDGGASRPILKCPSVRLPLQAFAVDLNTPIMPHQAVLPSEINCNHTSP